jgi:hypothetical protein
MPSWRGMSIKHKSWLENAFVLAVAGSLIAVIGTLATTVLPIMYGHEDISDFSITLDPPYHLFDVQNITNGKNNTTWVSITLNDFHKWLRPYKFPIHFQAISPSINDTYAYFDPQDITFPSPPLPSTIDFYFRGHMSPINESGHHSWMPPDKARVYI